MMSSEAETGTGRAVLTVCVMLVAVAAVWVAIKLAGFVTFPRRLVDRPKVSTTPATR